ncbi:MAG: hypothetical protein A2X64_04015 [Ignavibacteria bacterium GWF2_33_9]|nr:MAG: hypothetical protein A2X64_04015 [Ignavibacteria bacterium GWF2_33_9]
MLLNNKIYIKSWQFLLLFCLLSILTSCQDNEWISEQGEPVITEISPETTFFGDTLTIYGENLGDRGLNSFIVLSDSINQEIVHSTDCINWTISKVVFVLPNFSAEEVQLVCNSVNTNKLFIEVSRLPALETVEIPIGNFNMGSLFGLKDEFPVHTITISKPIIASKFEINQFYYSQVMKTNPSMIKDYRLPVDSITWIKAIQFCNELSQIQELKPVYTIFGENVKFDTTANGWRLPTEAEWEYMCKAHDTTNYFTNEDLSKLGWFIMNSGLKSHPSGQKSPNAFGLYDMQGNLWEWCWDFYNSDYYGISPVQNPLGPISGERHVARGGGYDSGNSLCRASNRFYPSNPIQSTGIRIVRTKF